MELETPEFLAAFHAHKADFKNWKPIQIFHDPAIIFPKQYSLEPSNFKKSEVHARLDKSLKKIKAPEKQSKTAKKP